MNEDRNFTDGEAIAAVLAGDVAAFEQIVERYQPALRRLAYDRLGSLHSAEEAVQETFMWAFRSLPTYNSAYSFRTWLWTILLNRCARIYARTKRSPTVTPLAELAADAMPDAEGGGSQPFEAAVAGERAERLRALLERLPPAEADALRLRFFGGLKFHEIADTLGCSLSAAKARVRKGLLKLSDMLAPREAELGVTR